MTEFNWDILSLQDEIPRLAAQARLVYLGLQEFLVIHLPGMVRTEGKLLDIGSGPGILTTQVAKHFPGYSVLGLDHSPEMIDFSKIAHPSCEWVEASAEKIPLPDGSVDVALVSFGLSFFSDWKKSLSELCRVLAERGLAIFVEPDLTASQADPCLLALFRNFQEEVGKTGVVSSEAVGFLEGKGLQILAREVLEIHTDSNDLEAPTLEYPKIHIGRMAAWGMISHIGQVLEMRDLYHDCLEKYMHKEIHWKSLPIPVYLLQKPPIPQALDNETTLIQN